MQNLSLKYFALLGEGSADFESLIATLLSVIFLGCRLILNRKHIWKLEHNATISSVEEDMIEANSSILVPSLKR
uniref:Uncharacterized protein n=1 Tax=Leersia perrieri TaxID=77586 RepID=A0A0D9VB22_9ORYZ